MITHQQLKDAYNAILSSHAKVKSSGQANDAFEVYVLSLVLRAAKEEGADVEFESVSGVKAPNPLTFRTSPGRIYSRVNDYSHAVIQFDRDLIFEAHVGVYLQGVAGVVHECDVLVIDRSEGVFCRRNAVHPKRSTAAITAECKFYAGKLGIDIGREFLGVTTDIGKEDRFLLSNSGGRSVDRVLAHHKRQRFFGLSPIDKDSENQVVALFRGSFRNQRARRR